MYFELILFFDRRHFPSKPISLFAIDMNWMGFLQLKSLIWNLINARHVYINGTMKKYIKIDRFFE